jgi:hypothetical protein
MVKGDPRLWVKEPGIAQGEEGYCAACAVSMIDNAISELQGLRQTLVSGAATGPEAAPRD